MADVKFQLGRVVVTPGAIEALVAAEESAETFLARHLSGDWGELDKEDWALNDAAVSQEHDPDLRQRVLSAYRTRLNARIWVITEHDRSVTTLLLPSEY